MWSDNFTHKLCWDLWYCNCSILWHILKKIWTSQLYTLIINLTGMTMFKGLSIFRNTIYYFIMYNFASTMFNAFSKNIGWIFENMYDTFCERFHWLTLKGECVSYACVVAHSRSIVRGRSYAFAWVCVKHVELHNQVYAVSVSTEYILLPCYCFEHFDIHRSRWAQWQS